MPAKASTAPAPALYAASIFSWAAPDTEATEAATAQSYRAAAGIASAGFHTSPCPWDAHVPGMNWAIPIAPTGDRARGLKPDSWCNWAASRAGVTSAHPAAFAASMIVCRYSAGMPSEFLMVRLPPP